MPAAEFQAALPEPRSILGVRLRPLSIGRYRLLKRFDSPFVAEEGRNVDTISDATKELFFALIVCGLGVQEFKDLLDSGKLGDECKRFGKHLRKQIKRAKGFNVIASFGEFQEYVLDSEEMPWVVLPTDNKGDVSATHWSHGVEVVLRSKLNWTKQEIDEEPLTKALNDYFKYMEGQGAVKLVTHEQFAQMELDGKENGEALEKMLAALN